MESQGVYLALARDYEIFRNLHITFVSSSTYVSGAIVKTARRCSILRMCAGGHHETDGGLVTHWGW